MMVTFMHTTDCQHTIIHTNQPIIMPEEDLMQITLQQTILVELVRDIKITGTTTMSHQQHMQTLQVIG